MFKNILLAIILTCVAAYFAAEKFGNPFANAPTNGWERKAALETPWRMSRLASQSNTIPNWPPAVGKRLPKIDLFDHTGNEFKFDNLRGKPTIVEFISMSCAGCQAFAGGNEHGAYGGLASQPNLESFESYFNQYTGIELHSGEVNFVVVVVYDDALQSPNAQDLSDWRKHFKMDLHENAFIVSGEELASGDSLKMIPGFVLLDHNQVVRFDSTGHQPKHNLYTELLPAVPPMLGRR